MIRYEHKEICGKRSVGKDDNEMQGKLILEK